MFFTTKKELFKIEIGLVVYGLTNSKRPIVFNGLTYEPTNLSRSSISLKSDMEKNSVTLTFPMNNDFASQLLQTFFEESIILTIYEFYDGETSQNWVGRLKSVSSDKLQIELKFENGSTKRLKSGAYRKYQRTCPYSIYGSLCRANLSDFENIGCISNISSNVISLYVLDSQVASNFVGGILNPPSNVLRYITKSSITTLDEENTVDQITTISKSIDSVNMILTTRTTIVRIWPGLFIQAVSDTSASETYTEEPTDLETVETTDNLPVYIMTLTLLKQFLSDKANVGDIVKFYPGCLKTPEACVSFGNIENFGGFPGIPESNPFVGTII